MKTITKIDTKIEGNKITITGELVDVKFPDMVAQRMTVGHFVSTNPHRPRQCRATNQAFMVERHGAEGFAWPLDEFVALALEVDPKLSDAPLIHKNPTVTDLLLDCKTETDASKQWQVSDDGTNWTNLDKELTPDNRPQPGKHYRVVLTNKSGQSASKSFKTPMEVA